MTKILLIDHLVRKKEIFEQCRLNDTSVIITESTKLSSIESDTSSTHIGLLFDNTGKRAPYFVYDDEEIILYQAYLGSITSKESEIEYDENSDDRVIPTSKFLTSALVPGTFFSPKFMTFIKDYKLNNSSFEYLDLITCNVNEEIIKPQAEELLSCGITVRYSTNFTGKNGDWIMESHNVNITDVYFRIDTSGIDGVNTSGIDGVKLDRADEGSDISIKDYPYQLGIGDEPPLNLTSKEDLLNLMRSTDVSVGGVLTRNYTIGNNIDMTLLDQILNPAESIGKSTTKFTGSFNGNNYTITIGNVATGGLYAGFFGFTNLTTGNIIQNVNLIYKNDTTIVSVSGTYAGCLVGWNIGNINNCNIICSSNVTFNGYYSGGLIGYAQGAASTINNCNTVFLGNVVMSGGDTCGGFIGFSSCNANFCVNIFGDQTTINGTHIGGLIGNTQKDSNILNCICIFGNSVIISGTNAAGIVGINSGANLTSVNSCFCFVNNYTIYGTTSTNLICTTIPFSTILNCQIHSFGNKLDNQGIQSISTTILSIFANIDNNFPETKWIIPLIRLRQKLNSSNTVVTNASTIKTNNKTYFSQLLGTDIYSTNVPNFIKHTAIKLSLSYSNQNTISTDFLNVKNLLTKKNTLKDTLDIEYINTSSNNTLPVEKGKVYYTPETTGTLTSNGVSVTFSVSLSPEGVYFDTTNFRAIGQTYSKNGIDFTVYGIGSGLFGISETGSKLYIGEIDIKNPTSGYDIITNTLNGLFYNTYKMAPLYTGNLLHVDAVYGDDAAAVSVIEAKYNIPFKTIQAAINSASSGQTVLVYPGTYDESLDLSSKTNISIRGVSVQTVIIQKTNVTVDTTLVNLGQNCRIEDVTLNLSSSSNSITNLIGVNIPSNASINSKLRTLVLNVNYTGTNSCNVYGIYSNGTSNTDNTSSNTIRASTINVSSSGSGPCRGILVSNANLVSTRDTNIYVTGTGTDVIGAETSNASAHLNLITSSVSGVLQDIKRTSGDILLSSTNLVNNNAGTTSFKVDSAAETVYFGVSGNLSAGTYNLVPGVTSLAGLPATAFAFGFIQKLNLINLSLRINPALQGAETVTFTLYKNNVATPLTLTANSTTLYPLKMENDSFVININDTIDARLLVSGNPTTGTLIAQCELY